MIVPCNPIQIITNTPFANMQTLLLTHWGRVTHLCVGKLTSIASDNGLSPGRRQAIIWTNAMILLIGPLGAYFSEILSEIHTFSFKKMRLKVSSAKWRPCCLGLNVLMPLSLCPRSNDVLLWPCVYAHPRQQSACPGRFAVSYLRGLGQRGRLWR